MCTTSWLLRLRYNVFFFISRLFRHSRCFILDGNVLAERFVLGKKYSGGINNLSWSEYEIQTASARKTYYTPNLLAFTKCDSLPRVVSSVFFSSVLEWIFVRITKQDLVNVCKSRITLSGDNFRVICLSSRAPTCKVTVSKINEWIWSDVQKKRACIKNL